MITSVVVENVGDNVDNNVGDTVLRKDGLIVVAIVLLVLLLSSIWKDGSVLGSNVDGFSVVVIVVDGSSDGSRDDGCLDGDDNSLLIITECNVVGINDGDINGIDEGYVVGSESESLTAELLLLLLDVFILIKVELLKVDDDDDVDDDDVDDDGVDDDDDDVVIVDDNKVGWIEEGV